MGFESTKIWRPAGCEKSRCCRPEGIVHILSFMCQTPSLANHLVSAIAGEPLGRHEAPLTRQPPSLTDDVSWRPHPNHLSDAASQHLAGGRGRLRGFRSKLETRRGFCRLGG